MKIKRLDLSDILCFIYIYYFKNKSFTIYEEWPKNSEPDSEGDMLEL